MDADTVMRLRSAQDMLLLGNADKAEADAVLAEYAVTKLT